MSKKGRATDEELLASLDTLVTPESNKAAQPTKPSVELKKEETDSLEQELGLPARSKPTSRPHTPRGTSNAPSATTGTKSSPKTSTTAATPTTSSTEGTRNSEEKPLSRKSGESSRSFHQSFTPASTDADAESPPEKSVDSASLATESQVKSSGGGGGGWWGALSATASAAVKQAEALAKEIQHNEEAQRWATQVKGNVGALRGFGGDLRSRALPAFTTILHTLAPPISSHERLQIHITHDLVGYPALDPLIYSTFSRVMAQVEGGDLLVIQRGQESRQNSSSGTSGLGGGIISSGGWNDGPWWRQRTSSKRSLGTVKGQVEGTKLAKASADSYATEYFAARGGLEEAAKQATETLSEDNPVRSSDIFLAVQAFSQIDPSSTAGAGQQKTGSTTEGEGQAPSEPENIISFAIHLYDPMHGISFSITSQGLPEKWTDWLDASSSESADDSATGESSLPDDIAEIVQSGGVDPREWVAEWVEESLSLGVGVIAQRYVARRMGVGLGGLGKGKNRAEALESGGGEAARVI